MFILGGHFRPLSYIVLVINICSCSFHQNGSIITILLRCGTFNQIVIVLLCGVTGTCYVYLCIDCVRFPPCKTFWGENTDYISLVVYCRVLRDSSFIEYPVMTSDLLTEVFNLAIHFEAQRAQVVLDHLRFNRILPVFLSSPRLSFLQHKDFHFGALKL